MWDLEQSRRVERDVRQCDTLVGYNENKLEKKIKRARAMDIKVSKAHVQMHKFGTSFCLP